MRNGRDFLRALVCVMAISAAVLAAQNPQDRPVFRGGVELVTVDVAVVDNAGRPITKLKPEDFTVVAAKRLRRVVSAQYVEARGRPAGSKAVAAVSPSPAPSSNTSLPVGRSFLFVIDIEQISNGGGRGFMETLGQFLDRLSPDDRVGIVSVPYGTPRVDLTTNRQVVKRAAGTIWGASRRNQGAEMTVGEAQRIERLDQDAVNEYFDRIRKAPPPTLLDVLPQAVKVMNAERHRARDLIDTLRALSVAMAPIEGPKSLLLVSEGLVNDPAILDGLRDFSAAAGRGHVATYAFNLQGPIVDVVSQFNMTTAHVWDHESLLDGMAAVAIAGRGDTFLISGTPDNALDRVDAEMSGYYLLSFERDLEDRDGQRGAIVVKVNTPGAFVRARTEFTLDKPVTPKSKPAPPADAKAEVGNLLRWPVPVTGLSVALDTYAMPSPVAAQTRVILASTIASDRPLAGVGYEVSDESGKTVADDFARAPVATERLDGKRQLYSAALSLAPGRYRVKLAAIDSEDRRGTVEHEFEVHVARAGAVQLGDVFVGELVDGNFLPAPSLPPGTTALPVRVDLLGDTAEAFAGAAVTLEFAHAAEKPFATMTVSLRPSADPLRRVALSTLALSSLPAGEYVVLARLTAGGAEASTSRRFTKK